MNLVTGALIAVTAFVVMEPVTAATHRWVMHGIGDRLHRSHHRRGMTGWEANDWFPVMFASIVMGGLWFAFNRDGLGALVPVAVGMTGYGAAYAVVHDVYTHGRVPLFAERRVRVLDRLAAAHRVHHLYGKAPFGMLLPVVPAELRERADEMTRDPLVRT